MSPSRRETTGIVGTATLTLLSGCTGTAFGGASRDTTETDQSGAGHEEATFEVRLSGPETDRLLFGQTGVGRVGEIDERDRSVTLPVSLTDDATTQVSETFHTVGVTETPDRFAIVLRHGGEEINRLGIAPALAENVAADGWDGEFVLTFEQREQATEVRETLTGSAESPATR